jgi:DNA-binding SARP family transcriptional activator/tetratricopeptide (TPR) repeat protein
MSARDAVRIRLVGSFAVSVAGLELTPARLGSRRARLLLELLTVERGRSVTADRAATVLWPDDPPGHVEPAVAVLVSRLRRVLGPSVVVGGRGVYRLGAPPDVEVDLDVAAALVEQAERRRSEQPSLAANAAVRALDLLGRSTLDDASYAVWADGVRAEHAALLRRARHAAVHALLGVADQHTAAQVARLAAEADVLDELACRDLMVALAAAGEPAAALAAYGRLRVALAAELGIMPSAETRRLHEAVLREEPVGPDAGVAAAAGPAGRAPPIRRTGVPATLDLVGRDREITALADAWREVADGRLRMVMLVGESGIGKTRLADEAAKLAAHTGGTVLTAHCHEAERSLFLQPAADALTPLLGQLSAQAVAELVGDSGRVLAGLLPLPDHGPGASADDSALSPGLRRRQLFDALCDVVDRLGRRAPVLLVLDDLHNAGRSTLEWLHYVGHHRPTARLLVLGTVRVEHADRVRPLGETAVALDVGPLSPDAVGELARAAGHPEARDRVMALTSGHTLYVLEVLQALTDDGAEITAGLAGTVLDRVRQTSAGLDGFLRAAAVLGATVEPGLVARLADVDLATALRCCERARAAGLLVVAGSAYEFAHDVVREVLYDSTPVPVRAAYHRAAADMLVARPEAVALHARAIGDWRRAARADLLAAEQAMTGLATLDAETLATRALDAAGRAGDADLRARSLLLRGRAREAAVAYRDALADLQAAVAIARDSGDRRLEMLALRQLGGDVSSALGLPVGASIGHLHDALAIAQRLGDRTVEADLLARLAVLHCNELRFVDAIGVGQQALAAARAGGDEHTLAVALDGLKTGYAYLGEVAPLARVVAELEPLLRAQNDLWRLQWSVFEAAFIPLAAGAFEQAMARVDNALAINRRSGFVGYEPFFVAHKSWIARLHGDLATARSLGEHAVATADALEHAWWHATALALHAVTLLQIDERTQAIGLLERAAAIAEDGDPAGYQLRCLAPLALATGSVEVLRRADALLQAVDAGPGAAWVLGADTYMCAALAWLKAGDPDRAGGTLAPLLTAARRIPWLPLAEPLSAVRRVIEAAS